MKNFPTLAFQAWFLKEKRALPWREDPTPYRVLVSEIMLQQTQAATVEPYFIRWMYQFPHLEDLAEAPEIEVLKAWEGLGYYSRARNLHKAARHIVATYQGRVPDDEKLLRKLPGIGPYTAAAIASFAFHKRAVAMDGNVLRVASRLFCIEERIDSSTTKRLIEQKLLEILPEEKPWVFMEGLIELGATFCGKNPSCTPCPLQGVCLAKKRGKEKILPIKKPLPASQYLERDVMVPMAQGKVLVRSPRTKGLMRGLYEFPYLLREKGSAMESITQFLGPLASFLESLPSIPQSFTKYRLRLFPCIWSLAAPREIPDHEWVSFEKAKTLPFSSAHRKIFESLKHTIYG